MNMGTHFTIKTLQATGAKDLCEFETIQSLWNGYGSIVRLELQGSEIPSVVVKHVQWPSYKRNAQQREDSHSHQRKVRSYQVEMAWYRQWGTRTDDHCRIPRCYALESQGDEFWMVLEDLDAAGYSLRKPSATSSDVKVCLSWLAHFHATFLGEKPRDLWKTGTYWHLATRPHELTQMNDEALRKAASAIDLRLRNSPFQTFVHGDAKLANFCFSRNAKQVAAVDFQYVGGGVGVKDVAYLIDSAFHEDAAERMEKELLDFYFAQLKYALLIRDKQVDFPALEADWKGLYPFAWTDFHRFLKGWSPGRWNPKGYSERLAQKVIAELS